jgi:aspartate/methionine/tyrosine aminotransferase
MFAPTRYLDWARRFYGKIRFDLATSGIPVVGLDELGVPSARDLDDLTGGERARHAIAAHNGVPAGEAIAALGTTHALWLAYASLVGPGDDILVEDPAYEPLVRIAEGIGARVVRFARSASDRFALDPERVVRAMTPRTRAVCMTNLHNPTGVRATDASLREVAEVAAQQGAHLVVDEVYAPFDALVDAGGVFHGSARRLAPNIVTVSSLTKCYGLGPHRMGWMLGPAEVIARAEDAMTACYGALPVAHCNLMVHALGRVGVLAGRARALLAGKRARVSRWIASMAPEGVSWSDPAEGLFALVTLPGAADITPLIEAAARDREVLVAAGSFFGVPNGFRVAWSAPADHLDEGLARLTEVLRTRHGRT